MCVWYCNKIKSPDPTLRTTGLTTNCFKVTFQIHDFTWISASMIQIIHLFWIFYFFWKEEVHQLV